MVHNGVIFAFIFIIILSVITVLNIRLLIYIYSKAYRIERKHLIPQIKTKVAVRTLTTVTSAKNYQTTPTSMSTETNHDHPKVHDTSNIKRITKVFKTGISNDKGRRNMNISLMIPIVITISSFARFPISLP